MADLCEIADVKTWLGIASGASSEDALLKRLVTATSTDFLNEIGRYDFAAADYTEILRGVMLAAPNAYRPVRTEPDYLLRLRHRPINTVASVVLDGTSLSVSADESASGYILDADTDPENRRAVRLVGYIFTPYSLATVTYNAGYATTPADVTQAVIEWTAARYRLRQSAGLSALQVTEGRSQSESAHYAPWDIPKATQRVIERYQDRSIEF